MDIVPLQLKLKNLYYETRNYGSGDNIIYIENSDEGFFGKMRKIWNKITKLIGINNAEDFLQHTLDNNSKYIEANILKNTNFVKDRCRRDEIIIVLDPEFDDLIKASLLEVREFEY